MKYLQSKVALALALTLTLGALLSASTAPVRAHGTQSAVALAMVEEQEVAIVSLARAAWRTREVRGFAYSVAAGVVSGVVEGLWGLESESAAKSTEYPKNMLD